MNNSSSGEAITCIICETSPVFVAYKLGLLNMTPTGFDSIAYLIAK